MILIKCSSKTILLELIIEYIGRSKGGGPGDLNIALCEKIMIKQLFSSPGSLLCCGKYLCRKYLCRKYLCRKLHDFIAKTGNEKSGLPNLGVC